MTYQIEKDKPVPSQDVLRENYITSSSNLFELCGPAPILPWDRLDIGDSFFVPVTDVRKFWPWLNPAFNEKQDLSELGRLLDVKYEWFCRGRFPCVRVCEETEYGKSGYRYWRLLKETE